MQATNQQLCIGRKAAMDVATDANASAGSKASVSAATEPCTELSAAEPYAGVGATELYTDMGAEACVSTDPDAAMEPGIAKEAGASNEVRLVC
jgi:hypothetical protein